MNSHAHYDLPTLLLSFSSSVLKMDCLLNNGGLISEPGFRFHPTDEELVLHYLYRKVMSFPLPPYFIPEINVCQFDPWLLPGDPEKKRYFFSKHEPNYSNSNRSNMAAGNGFWKATGVEEQIDVFSNQFRIVGMKKTHVFYVGKSPNGSKTEWFMDEYRLADFPLENWVLCKIFVKKNYRKKIAVEAAPAPAPELDSNGTVPENTY
ncbi:NAC domain-containing protein 83-like [Impatiens glandulifera]|uniref:NAC domain-containing protein 83-like n=1 Tax=Impatiens glandulifera TaxID=253017 RepID=UPI001FB14B15|nr:NAC domain-containing protein 83-like [Impatiens glandulifera]XP_047331892.1 NAC domain-containing protein 83-like [Impatiens glandulifera]XP_047331893.1 NAC domain-containing protein 83-like [Impatiens glandulifera]